MNSFFPELQPEMSNTILKNKRCWSHVILLVKNSQVVLLHIWATSLREEEKKKKVVMLEISSSERWKSAEQEYRRNTEM